jgi:hypothetical protein
MGVSIVLWGGLKDGEVMDIDMVNPYHGPPPEITVLQPPDMIWKMLDNLPDMDEPIVLRKTRYRRTRYVDSAGNIVYKLERGS